MSAPMIKTRNGDEYPWVEDSYSGRGFTIQIAAGLLYLDFYDEAPEVIEDDLHQGTIVTTKEALLEALDAA